MSYIGAKTRVYVAGASVAMTEESMSLLSGKRYKIDDANKRNINPAVALTILDDGNPVDPDDILEVDYLRGEVEFVSTYTEDGDIEITGAYLPLYVVAKANGVSLSVSNANADISVLGTDWRRKRATLIDAEGSFSEFDFLGQEGDGYVADHIFNQLPIIIRIYTDVDSGEYFALRAILNSASASNNVEGVAEDDISFTLSAGESLTPETTSWVVYQT